MNSRQSATLAPSPLGLATAIYLGIAGSAVLLILPIFVASLAAGLNLTDSEAGWIGSSDLIGYTIGSIVAFRTVDRIQWKHLVLFGLLLMGTGNLISPGLNSVFLLFATRVILSGLGGGLVISVAYRALARMSNPERVTGTYWTFNVLGGAAGLLFLPIVVGIWGTSGLFLSLAALSLSAVPVAFFGIRPSGPDSPGPSSPNLMEPRSSKTALPAAAVLILAGIAVFNLGLGGVWAFVDRPFDALGLGFNETGRILSGTYLVSMLGSSAAAWQGDRFGFLRPYAVSMFVMAGAIALLIFPVSVSGAVLALSLVNFCWNYGMTYQFSAVYASDSSGRSAVLIIFVQSAGLMLGPGIAGMLVEQFSFTAGFWFGIALCAASAILFSISRKLLPAPQSES